MVSLSLLNQFNDTLATSSRPTILTYTSPIISTSLTLLNSPLLITGFKKESETLLVPVMERYEFPATRTSRPRWAVVEIIPDGNKIQVYTTKLIFVAQFEGVRYVTLAGHLTILLVGLCIRIVSFHSSYLHHCSSSRLLCSLD
jgi:seipin